MNIFIKIIGIMAFGFSIYLTIKKTYDYGKTGHDAERSAAIAWGCCSLWVLNNLLNDH